MSVPPVVSMPVVRETRDFSGATYTEQPSERPFSDPATGPDLTSVITVSKGGQVVFTADPARVVISDAPGDCTNLLRVETLGCFCLVYCGHYCVSRQA